MDAAGGCHELILAPGVPKSARDIRMHRWLMWCKDQSIALTVKTDGKITIYGGNVHVVDQTLGSKAFSQFIRFSVLNRCILMYTVATNWPHSDCFRCIRKYKGVQVHICWHCNLAYEIFRGFGRCIGFFQSWVCPHAAKMHRPCAPIRTHANSHNLHVWNALKCAEEGTHAGFATKEKRNPEPGWH